ncbi:hepatocyte growth factor-regulated tyrosine kinase substrate-like isoform X2 [Mya arenaria]|uniref:hepatocyte growth factor-regulated tyrosine kinase substrate-like isoform X2 n=1 Tax=Mya arenaria TaxID=6604 RepID=UPI0022DFA1C8|nr:hepatocyte growth factor-regulated tyrosine kinase substrate-like isoform X2 [Mya arenaria]
MFGGRSNFDKHLEKATSQLLLEPDWDSILQISDCIRQGDVQPKHAVNGIKRKVGVENPHVSLYALQVLESCMKNCGNLVHDEVATKEFMEFLKNLVNTRGEPVKGKILELIQVWSHAFRNEPKYKIVQDTFNILKLEGQSFPQLKESDAMFSAEKAPEWKDADCCSRCRTTFGMVQRKHHCRACGDVVCQKCSSKNSIIPKYGIEKEVRVCDSCYDKINTGTDQGSKDDELPAEYLNSPLSKQSQAPPSAGKTEAEIQEEEELQLAIALSKSEEENKAKERERMRSNYGIYGGGNKETNRGPSPIPQQQPAVVVSAPVMDTSDMDPELARYLNRNYWEQKSETVKVISTTTTQPSAPVAQATEPKNTHGGGKVQEHYQNGETEEDPAQFLHALNSSVEIFVNRMRSNSTRGRSIAVDSSVQSLFNVISNMHPQLMKYVQQQEDLRGHYESLQDKLAQLRDAREALDALREDHREKKRREFEEMERLRQIQMAQKLDIMRQKKHEYLEMQRQLALQRMQEQEREMQMRFEQQRQLTQMRQMQNYGGFNQAGYPQGQMQGMPPQGMYGPGPGAPVEGSPVHQMQQGAQMAPGQGYMPQMYPPHGGQQPQYNQSGAGPQSSMYQSIPPQGTHQYQGGYSQTDGPAPGGMHGQGGGAYQHHHGVQYNAADPSGAQSLPQGAGGGMPGGQGPGAYTSMPPQMGDYQQQGAFNLQGMSNALPENQGYGAQPPPQQQQHHPHQQPPQQQQQQYYIGGQGGAPPPPAQQYPPQGIGQPQGVEPGTSQHKPGPHEAELISFD